MEVFWDQGEDCFVFKDMVETAASLFGMTVLEGKRESSCAAFLVNTLRPRLQKHLSWSRKELPISMDWGSSL